jgi:hypothetical protein
VGEWEEMPDWDSHEFTNSRIIHYDNGEWEDMPDEDRENMEKKLKNIEQNFLSFT